MKHTSWQMLATTQSMLHALYIGHKSIEFGATFASGHLRARRLMGKKLIEEFLWCEESAETLSGLGIGALSAFADERNAWPDRPYMPSREKKRTLEDLHHLREVTVHPRPPLPSLE